MFFYENTSETIKYTTGNKPRRNNDIKNFKYYKNLIIFTNMAASFPLGVVTGKCVNFSVNHKKMYGHKINLNVYIILYKFDAINIINENI